MNRLKDKVMIITGAGSGIGEATAKESAKEGATVVVTDIVEEKAKQVAKEIVDAGGKALGVKHDAASEEEWKSVIKQVLNENEKIDVLVNNAGVASPKNIVELTSEEWDTIQHIDQDSFIYGMRQIIPHMQKNGGGSIINISSIGGLVGMAGTSPYAAAKAAMRILSKGAAVDFGKDKIRVNSLHPGIIETPMTKESMKDARPYYETFTQLPYLGSPEDIAYGVIYLASDESSFVTGSELVIDGGWTAI